MPSLGTCDCPSYLGGGIPERELLGLVVVETELAQSVGSCMLFVGQPLVGGAGENDIIVGIQQQGLLSAYTSAVGRTRLRRARLRRSRRIVATSRNQAYW